MGICQLVPIAVCKIFVNYGEFFKGAVSSIERKSCPNGIEVVIQQLLLALL
jgi:hypothetical protein